MDEQEDLPKDMLEQVHAHNTILEHNGKAISILINILGESGHVSCWEFQL